MKSSLKAAIICIVSSIIFTSCNFPGITKPEEDDDDLFVYNSLKNESSPEEIEDDYTWILKPSIQASNIITPDLSQINTDNDVNRAYLNASIIFNNGKYGFIDYEGNLILEPSYDNYQICNCGDMILYNLKDNEISESCTLNIKGEIIDSADIHESSCSEYFWDNENKKIYVRKTNEFYAKEYTDDLPIIATRADITEIESNKYSIPSISNPLYALIKNNKIILDFEYDNYYAPAYRKFKSTAIALKKNGKWGYFSQDGDEIISCECSDVLSSFNSNLSDEKSHPYLFSYGYVPVCIDSKYYYYDMEGNKVSSANDFEQARPVINGKAWVKESGKWGIIQLSESKDYGDLTETITKKSYKTYWKYTQQKSTTTEYTTFSEKQTTKKESKTQQSKTSAATKKSIKDTEQTVTEITIKSTNPPVTTDEIKETPAT